jgi:hypothetical protein
MQTWRTRPYSNILEDVQYLLLLLSPSKTIRSLYSNCQILKWLNILRTSQHIIFQLALTLPPHPAFEMKKILGGDGGHARHLLFQPRNPDAHHIKLHHTTSHRITFSSIQTTNNRNSIPFPSRSPVGSIKF